MRLDFSTLANESTLVIVVPQLGHGAKYLNDIKDLSDPKL